MVCLDIGNIQYDLITSHDNAREGLHQIKSIMMLHSYRALLSSFIIDTVNPRLAAQDALDACQHLHEHEIHR